MKAVLMILEGPSDDTALAGPISALLKELSVKTFVVHGDITSKIPDHLDHKSDDVVKVVNEIFKKHLHESKLKISDFVAVFLLTDLDGIYLDKERIKEDPDLKKPRYAERSISHCSKEKIETRNDKKKINIKTLYRRCSALSYRRYKVPFYVFFMSCNLEHALFNSFNCSNTDKEKLAYDFHEKYDSNPQEFYEFLQSLMPKFIANGTQASSVAYDLYLASWKAVEQINDRIPRSSNLALIKKLATDLESKS